MLCLFEQVQFQSQSIPFGPIFKIFEKNLRNDFFHLTQKTKKLTFVR